MLARRVSSPTHPDLVDMCARTTNDDAGILGNDQGAHGNLLRRGVSRLGRGRGDRGGRGRNGGAGGRSGLAGARGASQWMCGRPKEGRTRETHLSVGWLASSIFLSEILGLTSLEGEDSSRARLAVLSGRGEAGRFVAAGASDIVRRAQAGAGDNGLLTSV